MPIVEHLNRFFNPSRGENLNGVLPVLRCAVFSARQLQQQQLQPHHVHYTDSKGSDPTLPPSDRYRQPLCRTHTHRQLTYTHRTTETTAAATFTTPQTNTSTGLCTSFLHQRKQDKASTWHRAYTRGFHHDHTTNTAQHNMLLQTTIPRQACNGQHGQTPN